ncbi:MAG: class II aldolase/adducin family protein [Deltaproteobacteria bacterium]
MERLIGKYARKIIDAGLATDPLICGIDDEAFWNRADDSIPVLQAVLDGMNINSLIVAEPAEPYHTILGYLAGRYPDTITPSDCETRTFLHDLPVTATFSAAAILAQLLRRKSVIVADGRSVRVVTFGTVSPEQAFVTLSSVLFSCFVLFFSDFLTDCKAGRVTEAQKQSFTAALAHLDPPPIKAPKLRTGPFAAEEEVYQGIIEAGLATVRYRLVDSYFGNISYRLGDTIYISQTGSSLDELAGCIDPCPMDGSSSAGITASSELTAHSEIYCRTDNRAVLHGHPKFSVILSMDCDEQGCPDRGRCHVRCAKKRYIGDVPVVPGEVGTGPTGLCHTLPPAIRDRRGVIVWGHGLFTVGRNDFNEAFESLLAIENMCRQEYFTRVGGKGSFVVL